MTPIPNASTARCQGGRPHVVSLDDRHPPARETAMSASSARRRRLWLIVLITLPLAAIAQSSGGSYTITKSVIAGGGQRNNTGSHVLIGTVGQPVTGVSTGGSYRLTSGFHAPASASVPQPDPIFANSFE